MRVARALQEALAEQRRLDLRALDFEFRWHDDLERWREVGQALAALGELPDTVVPRRDDAWWERALAERKARFGY